MSAATYTGPYVLLDNETGQLLGVEGGRIDLVHPSKGARYPTLAHAIRSRKYFGPDLAIVPASWLGGVTESNRGDAAEIDQWRRANGEA